MAKLLLMSVIFATVLIPKWTIRYSSPRKGLIRTLQLLALFNLLYLIALLVLWPRLLWRG